MQLADGAQLRLTSVFPRQVARLLILCLDVLID